MVAEIWASVMSSFVDQLVALNRCGDNTVSLRGSTLPGIAETLDYNVIINLHLAVIPIC